MGYNSARESEAMYDISFISDGRGDRPSYAHIVAIGFKNKTVGATSLQGLLKRPNPFDSADFYTLILFNFCLGYFCTQVIDLLCVSGIFSAYTSGRFTVLLKSMSFCRYVYFVPIYFHVHPYTYAVSCVGGGSRH